MTHSRNGNVLFIILIAIVLIGALTTAIMSDGDGGTANIDDEKMAIRISEVQRYTSELERAVQFILQNGVSESDIRFAHINAPSAYGNLATDTDKSDQIFARQGGGAAYRLPSDDISDASHWEFYGGSAMPAVGSNRADLIAVLPDVTRQFCDAMNRVLGNPSTIPEDTGTGGEACFYEGASRRFGSGNTFDTTSPNTLDLTTFSQDPNTASARTTLQACVECERDGQYHFYHVLMAR